MTVVIASLSEQGWITDPYKILNNIVSYYILTDAAQTLMFKDALTSLPETYYKYINEPIEMASAVKTDLDRLISRYFPIAEVETDTKQLSDSKYGVLLHAAAVTEDGTRIELSKVVEISTSGLRKIIEVNNFGDGISYLKSLN